MKEQTFVQEDFDVYENAKKMSDTREAEAEIEKLERQLQEIVNYLMSIILAIIATFPYSFMKFQNICLKILVLS